MTPDTPRCANCGQPFVRDRRRPLQRYCSRRCAKVARGALTIAERFWSKVDRNGGPDACWLWTGQLNHAGYGLLWGSRQPRRAQRAHRIAWLLANGQRPPDGQDVCHRCDVPSCVNPAHLFLGSRRANMQDAAAKGRLATGDRHGARLHPEALMRGEAHYRARLSAESVRAIRRRALTGERQDALAAEYGVTPMAINDIIHRRRWKHVS